MRWVVAETPGHHGWKVVRGLARSHVIRSDQRAGVLRQNMVKHGMRSPLCEDSVSSRRRVLDSSAHIEEGGFLA